MSSQHRLLSDLCERMNNLGPEIVGIRKDLKRVGELRDELSRQVDLIKNQPSGEVPKKMHLVAEAIQMLRKYHTAGPTTLTAGTGTNALNKVNNHVKAELQISAFLSLLIATAQTSIVVACLYF